MMVHIKELLDLSGRVASNYITGQTIVVDGGRTIV